jgi:hypothetical protein
MPNSNWAAIVPGVTTSPGVTASIAPLFPGIEKVDLWDRWFPTWKKLQVLAILAMFCFVHRVALLNGKALVALTTASSNPSFCDSSIRLPGAYLKNPRVLLLLRS